MARKILHIVTGLGTGGAEAMLVKLLKKLDRRKFRSSVLSLMERGALADTLEAEGIPVEFLGLRPPLPSPLALFRLGDIVRRQKPDLLQGWMYHGNLAATIGGWFTGNSTPVAWNVHHALYSLSMEKFTTAMVIRLSIPMSRTASGILYCAQVSKENHQRIGYRAPIHQVIPNGFDCKQFRRDPVARKRAREALSLKEDQTVIGLIGRYHPMKDHAGFLKAAALLVQQQPAARFILAGTGVEGGNESLAGLLREGNLAERCHLLGERDDVPDLLSACDVGCSSSWSEAFPNAIGEAMSCELPCVVTDVGDSAWMVGDTGTAVPPRDPQALAAALEQWIVSGREKREKAGKRARKRVQQHFSLNSVVARYEKFFDDLLRIQEQDQP